MPSETPAKKGRIDSYYTFKTINEEGIASIEASVIVRDQSPAGASQALLGALDGISSPAKDQLTAQ